MDADKWCVCGHIIEQHESSGMCCHTTQLFDEQSRVIGYNPCFCREFQDLSLHEPLLEAGIGSAELLAVYKKITGSHSSR